MNILLAWSSGRKNARCKDIDDTKFHFLLLSYRAAYVGQSAVSFHRGGWYLECYWRFQIFEECCDIVRIAVFVIVPIIFYVDENQVWIIKESPVSTLLWKQVRIIKESRQPCMFVWRRCERRLQSSCSLAGAAAAHGGSTYLVINL